MPVQTSIAHVLAHKRTHTQTHAPTHTHTHGLRSLGLFICRTHRPVPSDHTSRQVAQLKTILRERAIKAGISRRDYKKMTRAAVLDAGWVPIH